MEKLGLFILWLLILGWSIIGCGKDKIMTWEDKGSVWFTSPNDIDSTSFTFALCPESLVDTIIGIPISLCGTIESRDREIEIEVIGEPHDPVSRYEVIRPVILPADSTSTILRVKVIRTPNLDVERDSVAFQLKASVDLDVAFTEHMRHWLFFSNLFEQPEWWMVGSNAWYYLGEYDRFKMQVVNNALGSVENPMSGDVAQMNVNKYKLERYVNQYQPVYEDGIRITFPFMEN